MRFSMQNFHKAPQTEGLISQSWDLEIRCGQGWSWLSCLGRSASTHLSSILICFQQQILHSLASNSSLQSPHLHWCVSVSKAPLSVRSHLKLWYSLPSATCPHLSWLYVQWSYFQIRSHFEAVVVRISSQEFEKT